MIQFTRHFVSQRLGRTVGSVRMLDESRGVVHIDATAELPLAVQLNFCSREFGVTGQLPEAVAELILRNAIAHVHRETQKRSGSEVPRELRRGTSPWLGDWCTPPDMERRQCDEVMERAVAEGIRRFERDGKVAARAYLRDVQVPMSIIRRVLFTTRFRRMIGSVEITRTSEPAE
jgi:hypothetical protein